MNRRLIGLIVAVVLAALATVIIVRYVQSAEERAREAEELAEVFVAQEDIEAGLAADVAIGQGLIQQDEVPARSVPEGAVADLGQIEGQVAAQNVYEGEVIVAQRFGETVERVGDQLSIPEGQQAVSVQASVVPGVAGFVEPGHTVSILATIEGGDAQGAPDDAAETSGNRTQYLLDNVEVLAVGQRIVAGPEGEPAIQRSDESYIFTLALAPLEVEQLVFANHQGDLHFTLLPDDEQPETDTPGRSLPNAFN